MKRYIIMALAALAVFSCTGKPSAVLSSGERARYFKVLDDNSFVVFSPYDDDSADTIRVQRPVERLVCMSSSYIGYLQAIGRTDAVCGVSGIGYVTDSSLTKRYQDTRSGTGVNPLYDIGYEAALDYERILSLSPDMVLAYAVSASVPQYVTRLRQMGIPVLLLSEHLENHPLARAEYVELFGILTGCREVADSAFEAVVSRYHSLACNPAERKKVLVNIPYGDQWYVPGGENYMSRLVRDAGGEILGAEEGSAASGVISVEQALLLSREADVWINTGWCRTREQILSSNPAFSMFDIPSIYNNILRTTEAGGNDFWESGAFRADLILEDLRKIMECRRDASFNYYIEVK